MFVSIRLAPGLLLFLRGGMFAPLLLLLFLRGRGRHTAPMRQRQLRRLQHVFFPNIQPSGQCRECAGRPLQSQLATMPGAMRFSGKPAIRFSKRPRDTDLRDEIAAALTDADGKRGLPFRVRIEGEILADQRQTARGAARPPAASLHRRARIPKPPARSDPEAADGALLLPGSSYRQERNAKDVLRRCLPAEYG